MSVSEPTRDGQTIGDLVSKLSSDLSGLVRDEIRLAKVEITDDVRQLARAGGMLGAAAFAGVLTIVLLSFAAAWGLAEVMPIGFAFLVIAFVWAIAGAVLFATGRKRLQQADMKPEQTIETMQENVQWARQQAS